MAKKRTSLDSLFASPDTVQTFEAGKKTKSNSGVVKKPETDAQTKPPTEPKIAVTEKVRSEIIKQTVYLPSAVHEQLRHLAFEERKKIHDYLVEGLDRVFRERGLKSYTELADESQ